jgi:phosphoribosylformylglycinamidine synthase PurS subunit
MRHNRVQQSFFGQSGFRKARHELWGRHRSPSYKQFFSPSQTQPIPPQSPREFGRAVRRFFEMKAKIIVTPKKAVLDPQGKTVQNALEHMGYKGIGPVHVGKYIEIELSGTDKEAWRKQIDEACHKILSNPVIEDYRFEIVE